MCNCHKDAQKLERIDKEQLEKCANDIDKLFKDKVFSIIFDDKWSQIFNHASNQDFGNEQLGKLDSIKEYIQMGESAINQLNAGNRSDETKAKSFRLFCHQSRIFTFILRHDYHLVIINKCGNQGPQPDPNFDSSLTRIIASIVNSIPALSSTNIPLEL